MTCRDIMTASPICCLPSDSVAFAASIMKREDIGPVLVVSDHNDKRLLGIVTDRDLTIKVIAEGRNAETTRVDEVMTRNPVSCGENENTSHALSLMATHQVRRIPVVDDGNRLRGIIAQADVARHEDERKVGEAIEEISAPSQQSYFKSFTDSSRRMETGSFALGALCVSLGAGLMYMLDPSRGSTRRTRLQQQGSNLYHSATEAVEKKAKDLGNRASDMVASMRSKDEIDLTDKKLMARIRSRMGGIVGNPNAIQLSSTNGHVTVGGPILEHEVRNLLDSIIAVSGVRSVDSRLDVRESLDSHASSWRKPDLSRFRSLTPFSPALMAGLAGGLVIMGLGSKARRGVTSPEARLSDRSLSVDR